MTNKVGSGTVPEVGVRGGLPLLCPARFETGLGVFLCQKKTTAWIIAENTHKTVYHDFLPNRSIPIFLHGSAAPRWPMGCWQEVCWDAQCWGGCWLVDWLWCRRGQPGSFPYLCSWVWWLLEFQLNWVKNKNVLIPALEMKRHQCHPWKEPRVISDQSTST